MLAAGLLAASLATLSASAGTGSAPGLAALRICGNGPLPAAGARYVVLQASEHGRIAAIKRRSPGTRVLVYKDMASTRDDAHGNVDLPTGVGYAYANRYHPEWFLKDTAGQRVNWASWPHYWQMDVGNRAYRRAWARNVTRDLRRRGWDGVFVDGISRTMQYPWYLNGRVLAKYPGPDDYARATTRFLRRVGPLLRRRGLVIGNINDATPKLWRRWVGFTSGAAKEWWTKADAGRGSGLLGDSDWSYQMRLLREAQARHKIFIAITYGPRDDGPAMDYARSSFLLFAHGSRSAFGYQVPCGAEPASDRWRLDLGAPLGHASLLGGVWRRDFRGGIVVVNPSGSVAVTVPLGGHYLQPDGSLVTTVLLRPHSGLTLRRG